MPVSPSVFSTFEMFKNAKKAKCYIKTDGRIDTVTYRVAFTRLRKNLDSEMQLQMKTWQSGPQKNDFDGKTKLEKRDCENDMEEKTRLHAEEVGGMASIKKGLFLPQT